MYTMFKIHTNNHAFRPLGYNYPIYLFTIDYFAQTDSAKKRSKKLTYLVIFMQNRLLFLQLGSEANIRGLYILSGYPLGQGPGFRCP